jgi:hypothetical protein
MLMASLDGENLVFCIGVFIMLLSQGLDRFTSRVDDIRKNRRIQPAGGWLRPGHVGVVEYREVYIDKRGVIWYGDFCSV